MRFYDKIWTKLNVRSLFVQRQDLAYINVWSQFLISIFAKREFIIKILILIRIRDKG